jgi:dTDP-4-dehydrorhamnose 3,5-epimerase
VLHDLRVGSPTDGVTMHLDLGTSVDGDHDHRGVLIPPGVAHGFAAVTDSTIVYLMDRTYDPTDEHAIAWDDPDVGADWGIERPALSGRDRAAPRRSRLAPGQRPGFPSPASPAQDEDDPR